MVKLTIQFFFQFGRQTRISRNCFLFSGLRRLQNKGMQREVFLDIARQTAENAPRNPAGYFRTLLQNCERDGILTAEDM